MTYTVEEGMRYTDGDWPTAPSHIITLVTE